ncbi:hypothetical protein PYK79_45095 [Streptomyces sp. ID05-04B]|uniref:hypothetical protein n=1 Tax=unclassified Streptomyces TaxID=2593676 RepID=UPI000D219434|nr:MULTISPECIES: hypothetical protein [unclassified Streptomyces]AVV46432.1 hypothetical protein C6376_38845 [Streptomyces sp. P3]AVV46491.1 hypothetical protein C6376_39145 [Streptomyces sp. P3]MDX5569025.1 hypothetical protein [Streptomyces sp. ID05-04B]
MTYNLAPDNAPWFEHLTDSVDALGNAAREWGLAHRTAELAYEQSDPMRRILHDGKVTGQPGPEAVGWNAKPFTRSPHSKAVYALHSLYTEAMYRARAEYEHAALLYASGAAWAVCRVRAGEQPARVVFGVDDEGDNGQRDLVPGDFGVDVDAFEADRYSNARKLQAVYDRLLECLAAGRYAEDIGDQERVTEQEDAEAAECWAIAEGTADAAYAYGNLLRQALGFVLLGPRQEHRKQLAAAAEAATAAGSAPSSEVAQ